MTIERVIRERKEIIKGFDHERWKDWAEKYKSINGLEGTKPKIKKMILAKAEPEIEKKDFSKLGVVDFFPDEVAKLQEEFSQNSAKLLGEFNDWTRQRKIYELLLFATTYASNLRDLYFGRAHDVGLEIDPKIILLQLENFLPKDFDEGGRPKEDGFIKQINIKNLLEVEKTLKMNLHSLFRDSGLLPLGFGKQEQVDFETYHLSDLYLDGEDLCISEEFNDNLNQPEKKRSSFLKVSPSDNRILHILRDSHGNKIGQPNYAYMDREGDGSPFED